MKATEIIRNVMEAQGVTQVLMRKRLGIKNQTTLTMRLQQDNISVDKLNDMLRVLGYKMVIMPDSDRTPQGGYEVE